MVKFFVVLLVLFSVGVAAATKPKNINSGETRITYALWNITTGEYLAGVNDSDIRPIASITKLMSVFVTLKENLDLDEEVIVTGKERSTRIRAGMRLARQKLLELALISSDNLAARTLAETYPGGHGNFIKAMNRVATELGMNNTKYEDATGLLPGNISSADDLKKLAVAVTPYSVITAAANTAKFAFKAAVPGKKGTRVVIIGGQNTNQFTGKLDIVAAKTGSTSRAGRCLSMLFNHGGNQYFLVVMGAQSTQQRIKMVENLLDKIK